MPFLISTRVREKLQDPSHSVTEEELEQCFANRAGPSLLDDREQHRTTPSTRWFVAETDYGRKLKVCYIFHPTDEVVEIKSAYPATDEVQRIYGKYSKISTQ